MQQAGKAWRPFAKMVRDLFGRTRLLDTVAENGAKCQNQLPSWTAWYAHHRECCLLGPKERPVGTMENSGSSAGMPYAESSVTGSGSRLFGRLTFYDHVGSVQADVENDDPDTVPVSPPEKK